MKRMLVCALVLGLPLSSFSQQNANSLLGRLPEPPAGACGVGDEAGKARSSYLEQVAAVQQDIRAALDERNAAQEAYAEQNEAKWKRQLEKQMGLTDDQIAKVKDPDQMSEAEGRELADKVMQQRGNLSLEEAEKLGKMDEKAQEAWGKAYAAEMMAGIQAQTPQERAAAGKDQSRVKQLVKITQEQQDAFRKSNAEGVALGQKMLEWDREAQKVYARDIKPIDQQLAECQQEMQQAEGKRREALRRKLEAIDKERNTALMAYSNQFTPGYCDLLRRNLAWAKAAQSGFDRYEELENEKFKLQTNTPANVLLINIGTAGMQAAEQCANLMSTAFKYRQFSDTTYGSGAQ